MIGTLRGVWLHHRARVASCLLIALFAALPLATSAIEVTCALGLAVTMLDDQARAAARASPAFPPMLLLALVLTAGAAAGGPLREGIGHAWLLAPLVVVPSLCALVPRVTWLRPADVACWTAAAASLVAVGQRIGGLVAHGSLSHHLTLAYVLLPPLAHALDARRWALGSLIGLGVLATGSAGAAVALPVVTAVCLRRGGSARTTPCALWLLGSVATLVGLAIASAPGELRQRAILWTGGLQLAATTMTGPGGYAAASAPYHDALQPGFWFPNHAHDTFVQLLATVGWGGLVAAVLLIVQVLRSTSRSAAFGIAGVLIGGWTQDVLGDLEVARAAWAWGALGIVIAGRGVVDRDEPRVTGVAC